MAHRTTERKCAHRHTRHNGGYSTAAKSDPLRKLGCRHHLTHSKMHMTLWNSWVAVARGTANRKARKEAVSAIKRARQTWKPETQTADDCSKTRPTGGAHKELLEAQPTANPQAVRTRVRLRILAWDGAQHAGQTCCGTSLHELGHERHQADHTLG